MSQQTDDRDIDSLHPDEARDCGDSFKQLSEKMMNIHLKIKARASDSF